MPVRNLPLEQHNNYSKIAFYQILHVILPRSIDTDVLAHSGLNHIRKWFSEARDLD